MKDSRHVEAEKGAHLASQADGGVVEVLSKWTVVTAASCSLERSALMKTHKEDERQTEMSASDDS